MRQSLQWLQRSIQPSFLFKTTTLCLHCLKIKLLRWRLSGHLQSAKTGFFVLCPNLTNILTTLSAFSLVLTVFMTIRNHIRVFFLEYNLSSATHGKKNVLYRQLHVKYVCVWYLKNSCACMAETAWETGKKRHTFCCLWWEDGQFNPPVHGINLVFLDSLAQSVKPYGTAVHRLPLENVASSQRWTKARTFLLTPWIRSVQKPWKQEWHFACLWGISRLAILPHCVWLTFFSLATYIVSDLLHLLHITESWRDVFSDGALL